MAFKIIFLEEFGKAFVPKKIRPNLRGYLLKAGFDEVPYKFFGFLFYASALITTLIFVLFVYPYIKKFSLLLIYIYSFLSWSAIQLFFVSLFILVVYFYLDLKVYIRTKNMEEQLPEYLQVVSSNLKGGMTFERALWAAVKPRFGILGSEMAKASKKVMTGYELRKALSELADKYDSSMLRRTVDLIITEAESGGSVAGLIDNVVNNLKETKALKDEMSASALAYVIFISVIVIAISPLLFALAFNLLILILGFVGKVAAATQNTPNVPFKISKSSVNVVDFKLFSVAAIFVISLFSSLIVSIVEKGDIKGGLKYLPFFIFGSISLYFFFMKILGVIFGGIIPGA